MSKAYQDLVDSYPLLFSKEEGESQFPISLFGFECDIGWYNIIRASFEEVYSNYEHQLSLYKSWKSFIPCERYSQKQLDLLVEEYKQKTEEEKEKLPIILQIKEKYGTLRVYSSYEDERVRAIFSMAEKMSGVTCEICGNAGMTYRVGWHRTLCPEHAKEMGKIN